MRAILCKRLAALAAAATLVAEPPVAAGGHAGEEAHTDEEGHGSDGHGEAPERVYLDADTRRDFGVRVEEAAPGALQVHVRLPGEIIIDPDRIVHVVPRVPGVAREVYRALGDRVRAGETLAILDSRELSEMRSIFLVARERVALARSTFRREERLWQEKVSSEREYLAAQQALAEARIEMRAAEQKLHALGFGDDRLKTLAFDEDASFIRYDLTAPFGGIVVDKHIALGEFVKDEESVFVIADLDQVWVELTVYQRDLPHVRAGQEVRIVETQSDFSTRGTVTYVSPLLDEDTRTATARVVVTNDGHWRPGLFVEGLVEIDREPADLVVPRQALQMLDDETVVFVETDAGFVPRPVVLGRTSDTHVEIVTGLAEGERYAASGAFTLKAQLEKSSFDSGHNH